MHELGNVQFVAQGMRALKPPRDEMPPPIQKTATNKIVDSDAAAAVIRNPLHAQDDRQDFQYTYALFSASRPTKSEPRPKASAAASESSRQIVYSDPSKLQVKLADEINAINSFDGFLLGVHDKIEKFSRHTEFGLEQILEVEQHIAKLHETLELYKFTLKRIIAEALKALRCQGNLGPQRVLDLLRENISKQKTAAQVKEQQAPAASEQNEDEILKLLNDNY
jgi:hypothetical protein